MLDDTELAVKPGILTTLSPEVTALKRVGGDFANAGRVAMDTDWLQAGVIAGGLLLATSKADKRANQFAKDHQSSSALKNVNRVGNALPWAGMAGAALLALDTSDPTRAKTSFAAIEASTSALLLATGFKYAVGRSRPQDNLGNTHFNAFSRDNGNTSFPSRHSAAAWAVVTPYALQYDMPWLYGAAMLTNLARVGGRDHWVSDTVAGSLIGYGMGRLFWEASRNKNMPRVMVGRNSIQLAWETH